jgi:hypothetical protein
MYDMELKNDDRMPEYVKGLPNKVPRIRANRIFTNTEAVINSLIANPPKPNITPGRNTPEAIELAQLQEKYFVNRYDELNIKETLRKGLRNLYFGRLIVLKPYWNPKTNDFDAISIDPRKVRFAKYSTKEIESEFAIEEIEDQLEAVMLRFPEKADELMELLGMDAERVQIESPSITYKEAWIKDRVIFKYDQLVLGNIRNPYWDWDGLMMTPQEQETIAELSGSQRREALQQIRGEQDARTAQMSTSDDNPDAAINQTPHQEEQQTFEAYRFNHFDAPRKPYIFATVLNNENTPVGRTDFITQASTLQESVDRNKRQIGMNSEMLNGIVKVDSEVMSKEDAQKLRFEATGVIWGKGVAQGVAREVGQPIPDIVFKDMVDSREEIDNIMAASSAFRGERQGQETKAGRLALIQQSALRLNELVQVVDYVNQELFNWFYQLAKVRYTEAHYSKTMGEDGANMIMELIQDDFEDGTEIKVVPGRTLPEDQEFKYGRAQEDIAKGIISPIDYFKESGYQNPVETAKNAEIYKLNPVKAVGITDEELQEIAPQEPQSEPPRLSMSFSDLPPDGQVQLAAKAGIQLDPEILMQEKLFEEEKQMMVEDNKKEQFQMQLQAKQQQQAQQPEEGQPIL